MFSRFNERCQSLEEVCVCHYGITLPSPSKGREELCVSLWYLQITVVMVYLEWEGKGRKGKERKGKERKGTEMNSTLY